jgi:hypothetical protein
MKKNLILVLCGLLAGVVATWAVMRYIVPNWKRSAVDNTYWQVTSRLDAGGEAFAYFHAEEVGKAAQAILDGLLRNVASLPAGSRDQAMKGLGMVDLMVKGYGLEEISGVGFSSFAIRPGLHRVRTVIHHRPGRDKGLLWNILGPSPRSLDEAEMLPAGAALAMVSDYDFFKLIEWTSQIAPRIAAQGGGNIQAPTPEQSMAMVKAGLQMAGIDYDRLRKSYGGRLGMVLSLDAQKRVVLPAKEKPLSIPEPEFALLVRVNDTYLFDTLRAKLPPQSQARFSDAGGVKKIAFPRLPLPLPLEPVIVQRGEWLLAASRPALAERILDRRAPRLAASAAFREISAKAPRRGNGFGYIDPLLPRLLAQALRENMAGFQPHAALEKILAVLEGGRGLYWVVENTDQGLVYTMNHTLEISSLPGVIEAVTQIAAEKAREKAAAMPAGEAPAQSE